MRLMFRGRPVFERSQEGWSSEAIVVYTKREHEVRYRTDIPYLQPVYSPEPFIHEANVTPTPAKEIRQIKYQHRVTLDLWWLRVRFELEGGWHDVA